MRPGGRLRELAFRQPNAAETAAITAYVKPRNAVTCGHLQLMPNINLAVR